MLDLLKSRSQLFLFGKKNTELTHLSSHLAVKIKIVYLESKKFN